MAVRVGVDEGGLRPACTRTSWIARETDTGWFAARRGWGSARAHSLCPQNRRRSSAPAHDEHPANHEPTWPTLEDCTPGRDCWGLSRFDIRL